MYLRRVGVNFAILLRKNGEMKKMREANEARRKVQEVMCGDEFRNILRGRLWIQCNLGKYNKNILSSFSAACFLFLLVLPLSRLIWCKKMIVKLKPQRNVKASNIKRGLLDYTRNNSLWFFVVLRVENIAKFRRRERVTWEHTLQLPQGPALISFSLALEPFVSKGSLPWLQGRWRCRKV